MPRHRALLSAVTACGVPIGPSWIHEHAAYRDVTCAACRDRGHEFREMQRRGA